MNPPHDEFPKNVCNECQLLKRLKCGGNPWQILQEEEVLPLFQWITHSLVRPSSMHVS